MAHLYIKLWLAPVSYTHLLHILLDCVAVGAVGNMIDRIRLDYVVDFIYISLIDFPIFNVDVYKRQIRRCTHFSFIQPMTLRQPLLSISAAVLKVSQK